MLADAARANFERALKDAVDLIELYQGDSAKVEAYESQRDYFTAVLATDDAERGME